ncbi:MAG: YlxM family DNA-binding protein [Lachnospiraceae bacterium]|nr:YlxM family DNA-binding protein [Lachnospiraceae bacterium]
MEKIVEQGLLYDFYGELLTAHQKKVYEDFVYHDLSLSEIAEEYDISRQAAHDLIRRCDQTLKKYEDKLGLVARFTRIKEKTAELKQLTAARNNITHNQLTERVNEISNEILTELTRQ